MRLVKRTGHTLAATGVVVGHSSSHLFFVTDKSSGTHFLIDTGADVSVIPPSNTDRSHRQDFCLQAVNNTPIPTYGTRSLTLNLGLRRKLHWGFIIADVQRPIIGADFLHHFSLLVDISNHQLLDGGLTNLRVQGISSDDASPSPAPCLLGPENKFTAIPISYPDDSPGPPSTARYYSPHTDHRTPCVSPCSSFVTGAT